MQLVVNEPLVRDQLARAQRFQIAALATLGAGLVASFVLSAGEGWVFSYLSIVAGLILYQFAQSYVRRWGPRSRQDRLLAQALRGMDHRYSLLAFPSVNLPDYVLVAPQGVLVLVAKPQKGEIHCRADRWSQTSGASFLTRIFGTALGDPGREADQSIAKLKRHLDEQPDLAELGAFSSGVVIVFTHAQVRLRIDGCRFPVVTSKELRNLLRRTRGTVSVEGIKAIRRALSPAASS